MICPHLSWLILIVAGLFEVAWALGLKYTEGFTRPLWSIATLACMIISVWLLGVAMKTLPVGTAYAVWVGVGATGTVLLGILLLDEPASVLRLASVGLIVAGIIGLKLAAPN
jgi:quaternary ammonium compound-resistance protein SugE